MNENAQLDMKVVAVGQLLFRISESCDGVSIVWK